VHNLSKEFLEETLNSIADPVFVKDIEHKWIMLNDAFCDFMGVKRSELLGKSDFDFFPKEEAEVFWKKDEEVFQEEEENLNEEHFTDASGTTHLIETRKNIITDRQGQKYLVGIIRDITEKKQRIEMIEKSNLLLENFAYIASHDLKAPLQNIVNHADILNKEVREKLNTSEQKSLDFILESTSSLDIMVRSLLTFSKAKSQKLKIKSRNIEKILKRLITELQFNFSLTDFHIEMSKLPESIELDGVRIKQVFQNLLTNALKFRHSDRLLEISISHSENEQEHIFSVQDNGIGIAEENLDRIFSLFERLHAPRRQGNGIGLSLCELIVAQHNGRIWVQSSLGEGSTFYFSISKKMALQLKEKEIASEQSEAIEKKSI